MTERQQKDKNRLRGAIASSSQRSIALLSELRDRYSPSTYPTVVQWIDSIPSRVRVPLLPQYPSSYKSLFRQRPLSPTEPAKEIAWALAVLARQKSALRRHISLSRKYGAAVIVGDFSSALSLLDSYEQEVGPSLWLLDSRIANVQKLFGVERLKQYVASLSLEAYSAALVFLAHQIGQRNEDLLTSSAFERQLDESLMQWGFQSDWDTFIRFALGRQEPRDIEQCCHLLRIAGIGAPIDLYIVARATCVHLKRNGEAESRVHRGVTLALENLVKEIEVGNLMQGNDAVSTVGASEEGVDEITIDELIENARKPEQESKHQASTPLLPNLSAVMNRTVDGDLAAESLTKFGLNFGGIQIAQEIRKYVAFVRSEHAAVTRFIEEATRSRSPWSSCETITTSLESSQFRERGTSYSYNQVDRLIAEEEYDLAINNCESIQQCGDIHDRIHAAKYLALINHNKNDWWPALLAVVSCVVGIPTSQPEFKIAYLFRGLKWRDLREHSERLELSVGLYLALQSAANASEYDKLFNFLKQAALQFIKSRGVRLYSELEIDHEAEEKRLMTYFLSKVCEARVMEVNTAIQSSRGLSEERMRICQILTKVDPECASRYVEEIKEITYQIELEQGIHQFDQSRIYINIANLSAWAQKALQGDFDRYKSLAAVEGTDVEALVSAISAWQGEVLARGPGTAVPEILLQRPRSEADRILFELVRRLLHEFLENPIDGFDSYLSLRVRHGSFSGHLRGALEEANLVTSFDESTAEYVPNTYWTKKLRITGSHLESTVNQIFADFARRFDDNLFEVTREYIQIRRPEKPKGKFEIQITNVLLNLVKAEVEEGTTIEEFCESCFSIFLVLLEASLSAMREFLDSQYRALSDSLISDLRESLAAALDEPGSMANSGLGTAIARASTNLSNSIDRVRDWFIVGTVRDLSIKFSIRQVIDIGIAVTRNAHPGFDPQLTIQVDDTLPPFTAASGALILADILFIVLDNVFAHSMMGRGPSVHISADLQSPSLLRLRSENSIAPNVWCDANIEKLEKIRQLVNSDDYRGRVTAEGGTGFLKLRKIGAQSKLLDGVQNLRFGFVDDRSFFVEVLVPIREEAE